MKDIFIEYKLNWIDDKGNPDELLHDKLIKILKYVRLQNIKKYTITGFNKKEWKILINIR